MLVPLLCVTCCGGVISVCFVSVVLTFGIALIVITFVVMLVVRVVILYFHDC